MKTYKLDPGDTLNLKIELYITNDTYHVEFNELEIEFIIKNYLKLKSQLKAFDNFSDD